MTFHKRGGYKSLCHICGLNAKSKRCKGVKEPLTYNKRNAKIKTRKGVKTT